MSNVLPRYECCLSLFSLHAVYRCVGTLSSLHCCLSFLLSLLSFWICMLLVYVYLITHQVFQRSSWLYILPLAAFRGSCQCSVSFPFWSPFLFFLPRRRPVCRPACMRLWVPDCALDTVLWRPFDIMGYSVYFSVPSLVVDQSWKCQALLESTSQQR